MNVVFQRFLVTKKQKYEKKQENIASRNTFIVTLVKLVFHYAFQSFPLRKLLFAFQFLNSSFFFLFLFFM